MGIALKHPLRRPWTPVEEKLLGTRPDKEIAQQLKRDVQTVADRRRQLGIPHFIGKYRDWTLAEERLLGKVPDRELARRLGRTLFSIQNKRLKAGIPAAPNRTTGAGQMPRTGCLAPCRTVT